MGDSDRKRLDYLELQFITCLAEIYDLRKEHVELWKEMVKLADTMVSMGNEIIKLNKTHLKIMN